MSHVSNFVVAKPWWLAGRQTALQNGSWRESDMQEVEDTTWNHISYTCTSTARLTKKPFFQLCTNYHAHQSSSSDHSHVCLFTFQSLKYPPKTSNFPSNSSSFKYLHHQGLSELRVLCIRYDLLPIYEFNDTISQFFLVFRTIEVIDYN